MSEPGDLSSWGAVLELFDSVGSEPLTAARVAEETGHPRESIEEELDELAERGVLRTKAVAGERVWWLPVHEHVQEGSVLRTALEDAPDRAEVETDRRRLLEQHRQLADLATRINVTDDLDEILALITEEARGLVGAHQSVCSRTVDQNWAQAINEVSLSEKYADYRDYDTRPDGSGIYSLVAKNNRSMRMTQAELESHPAWEAFGDEAEDHPPMRGWLAVPIVGSDGENKGLVQLSDKYRGEFTEADEAILVQLANVAAAAIENAQLYDELQASERRYRRLFESMTEGYCVVQRAETAEEEPVDFRCVEANPAFEEHTGLDDVAERTIREVVLEDPEEWLDVLEEVLETGEVVTFEREFGSRGRVLRCQAFPVGDAPEGPVGLTVKDVTERVERERRLEESNERLEQFAHAASHDLQEPLRMVSSYLRLLENRYGDRLDEDGQEFLEFAVDGAERMREMVESLLAYSRVDTQGEPFEEVDLDAVLEDARADLRVKLEESDADLTVEDLPTVEGDADQLRQLFQNLLENAVDYSGEDPPTVQVACERTGARWVVSVDDEGVGIDPEHTDAVFQVFERLHSHEDQPGTGIGLSLCERIVERHGGEMWVESEPGEGSTFYFTLPAVGGRRE